MPLIGNGFLTGAAVCCGTGEFRPSSLPSPRLPLPLPSRHLSPALSSRSHTDRTSAPPAAAAARAALPSLVRPLLGAAGRGGCVAAEEGLPVLTRISGALAASRPSSRTLRTCRWMRGNVEPLSWMHLHRTKSGCRR